MKNLIKKRWFHIVFFEALASFILTYGFCTSSLSQDQIPDVTIALSYFLAISITGQVTGGYVNPIVTIGSYIDNRHRKLFPYLLAQFVGSLVGGLWSWLILGKIEAPYQQGWESIDPIKFCLNELIGTTVFTIITLTITNKFTSHANKSWQVYMSIPVALFLVRKLTGTTILNPAVGFSLQLLAAIAKSSAEIFYRDIWALIVPAFLGAIVGGYFITKFYQPLILSIKYEEIIGQIKQQRQN